MSDQRWRSLDEISKVTLDPHASISAQLRHMRKVRFGRHTVARRYCGDGLYQYRLTIRTQTREAAITCPQEPK
jgi:hypothetical protein